jgi:2-amino-4-hydroxy-6-hydroxymethyldihydropteridine diphosphokinase
MARVEAVSSLYETEAVGGPPQPRYLNTVCRIRTELAPRSLLDGLKALEREIGRDTENERWGPRHLDLDILLYDELVLDEDGLVIPHPRLAERAFVLVPLAEIAPDARHPLLASTMSELATATGASGVTRVAGAGWSKSGTGVVERET